LTIDAAVISKSGMSQAGNVNVATGNIIAYYDTIHNEMNMQLYSIAKLLY
jgi:hypothetical protein